ncbi:MAG TPA: DNA (cytosine-5-)-methyltransferase [Chloroflexi bacterium]|nr:DNA (cytosine-5-)-methyltransferase [Chloroflexota bacterium]
MSISANGIQFTVAEYFAGIGLVRMGLERCDGQVVWANDISAKKFEIYKAFFPSAEQEYVVEDIFSINPDNIPATTLATCSFPCINLSVAGKMDGIHGKHSSAFWGFVRAIEHQRGKGEHPPLIMVENVPGWLYSNKGQDFRLTVQALNDLGYVCDVFTVNARSFVPQSRLRVFLIGMRSDVFGQADDGEVYAAHVQKRSALLAPDSLRRSIETCKDLAWKWLDIPEPPPLKKTGLASIVEDLPEDHPLWWPEKEVQRHLEMMAASHRERVKALMEKNEISYRTFFRRMRNGKQRVEVRRDEIAGCLRTAVGGSAQQFILQAGKGRIRMRHMTPREYARLQGTPDAFFLPPNIGRVQALTGFGDAVCVDVIEWIACNVITPLVKQMSVSLSPNYARQLVS